MGVPASDPLAQLSLPPGFRFYPTDEELLVQYLCRKVAGHQFSLQIIGDIDLYKFDPWDLPSKAIFGEKEWYFFSPRDRKYPNGSRPNRVAGSGYWKATGTDKVITTEGRKVGIKKALVFYVGKAPKGTKTNWIMHEYRLFENHRKSGSSKLDEWVLCRIYKKNSSAQKSMSSVSSKEHSHGSCSSSSSLDDMLETLPEINDRSFALPRVNSLKAIQANQAQETKPNLLNLGSGNFDWASLVNPGPHEFVSGNNQYQAPTTQQGVMNFRPANDVFAPGIAQQVKLGNSLVEEEVQSGLRRSQQGAGLIQQQQNSGLLAQNFPNMVDPYGFRYPTQAVRFGFRQ